MISDCQASKGKSPRRINGSDFMKSNKDQNIAQRCSDEQKKMFKNENNSIMPAIGELKGVRSVELRSFHLQ